MSAMPSGAGRAFGVKTTLSGEKVCENSTFVTTGMGLVRSMVVLCEMLVVPILNSLYTVPFTVRFLSAVR